MSVAVRYALVLLLALPTLVRAADETSIIAPLVDAETAAVAHVDFSRLSIDAAVEFIARSVPEAKPPLAEARRMAVSRIEAFRRAGGKDVYLVVSFRTPAPLSSILAAFPIGAGADEQALRQVLGLPPTTGRRIGNLLVLPLAMTPNAALSTPAQPADRPELRAAFAATQGSAIQLLFVPPASARRVVEELVPQLPPQVGGGSSTVLTRGLQWAALGLNLPPQLSARLVVQAADAGAATKLLAAWQTLLKWASQDPKILQAGLQPETLTALPAPVVENDRLVLTLDEKSRAIAAGLTSLQRVLEEARTTARRTRSANNLRQLGVALHNYHESQRRFPAAASFDRQGKPLLSWRVHLLPYLDQEQLYREFHLDEPWDSPHNKTLVARMPPIFLSPFSRVGHGTTNYLLPVGDGALYASPKDQPAMNDIRDGAANTIMLLEVDDAEAVVWTRPDDWAFDRQAPQRGLGHLETGGFQVLFCDGSSRFLPNSISASRLKSALTRAGGEKPEGN
jgi:hypothetical protein